jgi:hypothetical protein
MKKIVFIIGCLSMLFFSACQKEMSDNFTAYPGNPLNDTVWLRNVTTTASVNQLLNALLPQIIVDSFDISKSDTTLNYGDSLSVTFTAGSCIGNSANGGTPGVPAGKVKLELLRLKKKGDFIKAFKPTTAANGYLLETGGGFFIRVTKDGKELNLAQGATVKLRFSDTGDVKPNMQAFYGKENTPIPDNGIIDTAFTWIRDTDTTWLKTFKKQLNNSTTVLNGYELNAKNLRWIAAERYVDSTLAKTKITAILSPNFTNKTTAVFAVFANQNTVVNLSPDYASRSFATNKIPIGTKIKLVSISKIGDDFYLGTKDIINIGSVTSYSIVPEKRSLVDILYFLNTL